LMTWVNYVRTREFCTVVKSIRNIYLSKSTMHPTSLAYNFCATKGCCSLYCDNEVSDVDVTQRKRALSAAASTRLCLAWIGRSRYGHGEVSERPPSARAGEEPIGIWDCDGGQGDREEEIEFGQGGRWLSE
jgi:hypothetical protein